MRCSSCGFTNPAAAEFCHECGQRTGAAPAPAAASVPETSASGRYRILPFVGEGSKKRAYQARDERLERDVTLALVEELTQSRFTLGWRESASHPV